MHRRRLRPTDGSGPCLAHSNRLCSKNALRSSRSCCVGRRMMSSHRVGPEVADAAAKQADAAVVDSNPAASPRVAHWGFLRRCITLFGIASLAYMLGAAVVFFEWPSSSFL